MSGAMTKTYIGRIVSVRSGEGYGFIGIGTITKGDGTAHDLATTSDVFIHQDECAAELRVGTSVHFEVIADQKRGDGHFRAIGATTFIEAQVVPADDPLIGHCGTLAPIGSTGNAETAIAHPLPPHPWKSRMKEVPAELVAQAGENHPLPNASRAEDGIVDSSDPRVAAALSGFLAAEFPQMAGLDLGYDVTNVDEDAFNAKVAEAAAELRSMGMEQQAALVEREVARFRGTRRVLAHMLERNMLRRNTFIPVRYLPDLFAAVPVWYFATKPNEVLPINHDRQQTPDPMTHARTIAMCNIFPGNLRWADTFQMFNRRLRSLAQYTGDVIPVPIVRLIREAQQCFDHVVIATPYHDVAGADWDDLAWIRSIDPYVFGFQDGCSHFFVLGRFSDSGVFPLYHELVGDTIAFLRTNVERLEGFNTANHPYWYVGKRASDYHEHRYTERNTPSRLGDHLKSHVGAVLHAFESGHLFDWLREEWNHSEEQPQALVAP